MKKAAVKTTDDDMQPEYDFSRGVRGKYAARYQRDTNVVVLEPDVAREFTSAADVNNSLRALASLIHQREKAPAGK